MNCDDASTRLLTLCAPHLARTQRPWVLALSGLPGSGKSTLAASTVAKARREGWPALALSLDDFYLPRRARQQLAAYIHPLLITRGVPGTHDLALLRHVLAQLPHASDRHPVPIPRFDKGRDTRQPPSRWRHVRGMPRLVILEGWCLGITPQPDKALRRPVNPLEREEDVDGHWRHRVNHLLPDYLRLWNEADARALIRVPDWQAVRRHRHQAEQALRQRHAPQAMDDAALDRFLQHYERLCRHALKHPPTHVDLHFTRTPFL
ncbi:MAG TPA: kinase [Rhodanobacteraceae bacterium]|nr:kinase [Rhodanobacteraceae bacterium]